MMKRWKRFAALAACAALCLSLLTGCGPASGTATDGRQQYRAAWYDVFDTVTTLIAYCDSQEEFDALAGQIHSDLLEYHQLYDIYHEYEGVNNLYTVNANAGIAPVPVDEKILAMLEEAVELHDLTGGKMNVALGSVLSLWHETRAVADEAKATLQEQQAASGGDAARPDDLEVDVALPDPDVLAQANAHTAIGGLVIDRAAGTVYLSDPGMLLDVGSCGKGYACEMAAQAAAAQGADSFLLSVGGNLRGVGTKPGGVQWTGGVQDPTQPDASAYLQAVYVSDMALVTSGDYQRYFMMDGVRYHHLIDPDTLQPAAYFRSVSILCPDSGLADCLSTGVFCMTLEEGQALIESLDGVEAFWVLADGSTAQSSGWAEHVR